MASNLYRERLTRRRTEIGLTVDDMLDAAREHDPDGYSREALRAMYNGARRAKFRGMAALAKAVELPAAEFPELRLAYAQYLLDDLSLGMELALKNLDEIDPDGKLDPDDADPRSASISRRKETIDDAKRKARALERRLDPASG